MSEETKDYRVVAKLSFNVSAKSVEHARVIVENGVSYAMRLGLPIELEVSVLGELKPRPVFEEFTE